MSERHDTSTDHEDHAPADASDQLVPDTSFGSGLAVVYDALDRLVAARALEDAAVVVDVAPLGRQVLHAGRRPMRDDEHGLLTRAPGLHVVPAATEQSPDDALVEELLVALAEVGLRCDAVHRALSTSAADA